MIHSDNDFATVAYLRIQNAVLIPKEDGEVAFPKVPPLLEDKFAIIRAKVAESTLSTSNPQAGPPLLLHSFGTSDKRVGPWISVSNIQREATFSDSESTLDDEVRECFHILRGLLNFLFAPRTFITTSS